MSSTENRDENDSLIEDPTSGQDASESRAMDDDTPEGPAPTPFDHPLFLPILLFAMMLWFGYDGWINPEMEEHRTFNQVGFALLLIGALWTGIRGYREWQEEDRND